MANTMSPALLKRLEDHAALLQSSIRIAFAIGTEREQDEAFARKAGFDECVAMVKELDA